MAEGWDEGLKKDLQDLEFAKLYGAAQAKDTIAITIAKARLELGLTQQELASKFGATQPYIAKLERGDANPTVGTIGGMLAILGLKMRVSVETLIPPTNFASLPSILQTADDIVTQAWKSVTADEPTVLPMTRSGLNTAGEPALGGIQA